MDLPQGWISSYLLHVCSVATGKVDANHADNMGEYDFFTCALEPLKSKTFSFDGELIILPGNGANVGHVAFYAGKIEAYQRTYILNSFFIETRYIYYHLKLYWKSINKDKQFGTATNYIKLGNFQDYQIVFPSLAEQKEIVRVLESHFKLVDQIKSRLDALPKILEQFRQSVLASAVSGKLTEDWRKENNFGLSSWHNSKLLDFIEKPQYGSSAKSDKEGLTPVLRMGNIQNSKLDWSDLVYTSDRIEIEKFNLEYNDLLFNRTNSPELVGKTAIYKGEQPAIFAGYLIRVRCLKSLVPDFLNYSLNSNLGKKYCWAVKTDGVSQSNINAKKLSDYPICVPTVEEQKEIVGRVENLFALADQIEEKIKNAQERVNLLTQSILAKAFRGELTAKWREENQDLISGENSAEALLKRIEAEKKKSKKK